MQALITNTSTYTIFGLRSMKGMSRTQTYFLPIEPFFKLNSNLSIRVDLAQNHTSVKLFIMQGIELIFLEKYKFTIGANFDINNLHISQVQ